MKTKLLVGTIGALAVGAWAQGAGAGVVLSDNFGTTGAEGNWPGDGTFTSIPIPGNTQGRPSVDLVGPGFYDNLADGAGNSVDLDGSTGGGNYPAGELLSVDSFAAGKYTLVFDLAGNLRGVTAQTTEVLFGGTVLQSYTPANNAGYTFQSLSFTSTGGNLEFLELGPSDQQGNLLDNVTLFQAVPEPASWALMLLGFGGLGLALRSSRKAAIATA